MERVYRFEATFTELVPVGQVPEGIRLDAHFTGRIVEGPLTGGTVRGIDYLLFRPDGVGIIDVHELVTGPADERISVRAYGYVTPPARVQLPPADVMLRTDFTWPELELPLHGFALCQTAAADLAWLNRTALAFEGSANPGAGKLLITASALVPIPRPVPA